MSHYSLAILHREDQKIDDLLAPYDENLKVEPYVWLSYWEAIEYARKIYHTEGKSDDDCWRIVAQGHHTDAYGNIYSTYNKQAKWDRWTPGSSWCDMLNAEGELVDSGRFGDLTFPVDQEAYNEALRYWDEEVIHKNNFQPEKHHPEHKEKYYREYYGTREDYARRMTQFSTYAVITPDGEWHSCGEMGRYGRTSESGEEARDWYDHYKERFLDTADKDWHLTIVDCHT